jgi:hypothetical protein
MITPNQGSYGEYAHGYGLFSGEREDYDGRKFIWSGGEMIGYHAILLGDLVHGIGVVVLINGEAYGEAESEFAFKVLSAILNDKEFPALPASQPPRTVITDPSLYTGFFICADKSFRLQAEGDHLIMLYRDGRIVLEQWHPGVFYVQHPDFKLALLKVVNKDGIATEAVHGADWFWVEGYEGPTTFDYSEEWDAYVGHYHTYSPWMNDFRIYVRKGQLYLQWWGIFESLLSPLGKGVFRYGESDCSPERLRFDAFVAGRATRAILSGAEYYRIESP